MAVGEQEQRRASGAIHLAAHPMPLAIEPKADLDAGRVHEGIVARPQFAHLRGPGGDGMAARIGAR
jgi:hypothetical protein